MSVIVDMAAWRDSVLMRREDYHNLYNRAGRAEMQARSLKETNTRLLATLEALVTQAGAHIGYPCPELEEAKATIAAAKG